ncbi:MAG: NAD(P)-dependent oxidoreductase [Patescibacteria group bacterium]
MKQKTILITGAGGMLGDAMVRQFSDAWKVVAVDRDLDVTRSVDVEKYIKKIKPHAIAHLAAMTDLEYCESHPAEAYATNALGVANVVDCAQRLDIPVIFISTARIFNGKKIFHEHDAADPIGVYGQSKYAGEIIARSYSKSIIIRAGWMVGGGPTKDKKFVNKIIQRVNAGDVELKIVEDALGSISYTYDVASTAEYLLTRKAYGIYHCVCDGGATRFEIAEFVMKELGLAKKVRIARVDSGHWKKEYFSPRPASERLANTILKKMNPSLTRPWRKALSDYLKRFQWLDR